MDFELGLNKINEEKIEIKILSISWEIGLNYFSIFNVFSNKDDKGKLLEPSESLLYSSKSEIPVGNQNISVDMQQNPNVIIDILKFI